MQPNLKFSREEYADRLARTRAAMEAKGIELLIVSDPSNMALADRLRRLVVLRAPGRDRAADGDPIWYGRGQDADGAQRTAWLGDADIVGYPDHYVQSTERHPMDYLAGVLAARGLDRLRPASRWTTTGSPPPPSRRCSGTCRTPASPTPPASSTGSARSRARPRSATCARPPASSRRCTPASPTRSRLGMRKCDLVAEILDAGTRGVDGYRRRLPGDRAAAALRRRRLRAAPHLGRQADEGGRGHLLRDRRLLPPLPLPAVAHRLPRQADAGLPRRRGRDARRHGGRPRRGEARQHLRGHRQRPSSPSSPSTASSRTTAPATRSASPTRPTGASAP